MVEWVLGTIWARQRGGGGHRDMLGIAEGWKGSQGHVGLGREVSGLCRVPPTCVQHASEIFNFCTGILNI